MNGIHDMGGMHGFGPVDVADDAAFHYEWEPRARAIAHLLYSNGYWNLDAFRNAIEHVSPSEYLSASYFERWLRGSESCLIDRGYVTQAELNSRIAEIECGEFNPAQPAARPVQAEPRAIASHDALVQRFEIGDSVRVRNIHGSGHTRAPRYLRGKVGTVQGCRGHEVFPDTNASFLGDRPQVVYSVTFEGHELWGDSAESGQLLSIDLWDAYLESV